MTSFRSSSPSAVSRSIVAYGRELSDAGAAQVGGSFTDNAAADELVRADPFAFLIGVLFTQGIPAERAWAAPYLLRDRLGHLDPARIASDSAGVRRAVQKPPMLHRFKETLPGWIVSAGSMVETDYGGHAERIWVQGSHTLEVTDRLTRFPGIGRKKSVMAVEILKRHFGIDLAGDECGQVAYDVHVRRVFLRSGLVAEDTPDAVAAAARRACAESPGTLDLAAWLIGRETCRPREPRCDQCRLGSVCPRLTALDAVGVGARTDG